MTSYTFHVPPPCNEAVEVIFVDEDLLVVRKPAGLLSVPGRIVKDSVLRRMQAEYPDVVIVHRLDLDTSGLLVLSRSRPASSDLNRQFRERTVSKEYVAVVDGVVNDDAGEIDLPIRSDPDNRPRQMVDRSNGRKALTRYRVLRREDNCSRLQLTAVTGRSHQLRIHLAEVGHPILGCDLYATEKAFRRADRLLLHATCLGFIHPGSGKWLEFESNSPF
ncbi:MAG: RNA pseudouridine synthase [Gammaproteobacteria bacterium]|nr:RNA pseudouridine synthase [Gammaproteobacteria bacterium]